MVPGIAPKPPGGVGMSVLDIVKAAGQAAGLVMALDTGDRNSFIPGAQTLADLKGSYSFTLGSTTGASTDDPTFSGTSGGKSAAEKLAYDGGDFLILNAANDTFMNGLHKLGGEFTFIEFGVPILGGGGQVRFGTVNVFSASGLGVVCYVDSSNRLVATIGNGSGVSEDPSVATVTGSQVNMMGFARKTTSTTNRDITTYLNGTFQTANVTSSYTPSASNSSTARISGAANGAGIITNGGTLAAALMFNRLLVQADFDAIRAKALKRWPTI